MDDYLKGNKEYYEQGYNAECVDHCVFRVHGSIFRDDFGMDGSGGEKLLDFGCGQGTHVNYFREKGFDAYGIDVSEKDLGAAQHKYPDYADHFQLIDPKPAVSDRYFGGGFDVVVGIQTFYFLSDPDLQIRLKSLYDQMNPGAVFYATMMGTDSYYWDNATPFKDGLYSIKVETKRIKIDNYHISFVRSEAELKEKFSMFAPVHIGFYNARFRSDEGCYFHYTFVGRKPLS